MNPTFAVFKSIRKLMPQPTQVMGERKRKNAYKRKEKHKQNLHTLHNFD